MRLAGLPADTESLVGVLIVVTPRILRERIADKLEGNPTGADLLEAALFFSIRIVLSCAFLFYSLKGTVFMIRKTIVPVSEILMGLSLQTMSIVQLLPSA